MSKKQFGSIGVMPHTNITNKPNVTIPRKSRRRIPEGETVYDPFNKIEKQSIKVFDKILGNNEIMSVYHIDSLKNVDRLVLKDAHIFFRGDSIIVIEKKAD